MYGAVGRAAARGILIAAFIAGCSSSSSRPDSQSEQAPPASSAASASEAPPSASRQAPRIVVLGDSLTAGLGLPQSQAFPAILDQMLRAEGYEMQVINAGISGDTSAGGRRRLNWALEGDVRVLIVALGANDGLRGIPVAAMKDNLRAIIREAKSRGTAVLLLGMEAQPNLGAEYTSEFRKAFHDLADDEDVALVPFFLNGVAGIPGLNQSDGVHPNAEGARRIAANVWIALQPLVGDMSAASARRR